MISTFDKIKSNLAIHSFWQVGFALASGVFAGTSYIPFFPWALPFLWAPLLLACKNADLNWRRLFFLGWLTQFVLSLIGFYWIAYVSHEFGFMPWPLAIAVAVLFAATVHLYIPFALVCAHWCRKKRNLNFGQFAILFCCFLSMGEAFWPSLFPWNFGYTLLWIASPIAQWADAIGFLGLSFLIALTSAALAWIFLERRQLSYLFLASIFCLWSFFRFTGEERATPWKESRRSLNILQVQANISNLERMKAESGQGNLMDILRQFTDVTDVGLRTQQTDLIVWPEGAFPDFLNSHLSYRPLPEALRTYVAEKRIPLLTGSYSSPAASTNKRSRVFNSLFLLNGDGTQSEPVDKTLLLPLGDYTPFADRYPWLAKISPVGVGFAHGKGPQTIPFQEFKIGAQICYESLYPEFTTELVHQGADLLVNLTNDSWFGPTSEPPQHMLMTLARAIEARRPLVRSTNTGITTGILATGKFLQQSPLFQAWQGHFFIEIPKKSDLSFYSQNSGRLRWAPLLIALLILLGDKVLKRESKDE